MLSISRSGGGSSSALRKAIADKTTKLESLRKRAKEAQDAVDLALQEGIALERDLVAATEKCILLEKAAAGLAIAPAAMLPSLQLHPDLLGIPGVLQIKTDFDAQLAILLDLQKRAQQQVEQLAHQHHAAANAASSNLSAGVQQQAVDTPAGDDCMDPLDDLSEGFLGEFLQAAAGLDKQNLLGVWSQVAKRRKKAG